MNKLFLALLPLLFFSCEPEACDSCNINIEESHSIKIDYARNFNVNRTNVGYRLELIDPNSGDVEKTVSIPSGKDLRIISLTTTLNGMLAILEKQSLIIGITDEKFIYDKTILERFDNKLIETYGDATNFSFEKIVAAKPDIIFYSGFGDEFPLQKKLEKLGIIVIPIYDWRENHPLGKAEWIKLVGIIADEEEKAQEYFNQVVEKYDSIVEVVKTYKESPTVIAGGIFGDVWYAPGGDSYFSKLLQDAGGNYRYAKQKGTTSLEFSLEQVLKNEIDTKYWINPGVSSKVKLNERNNKLHFLKSYEEKTYCYSSNMNRFWEQSAAMPHLVLKDLATIFHSEEKDTTEMYFYNRVK
ncbi:ABC transporter substrate-binding protein [Crocinitomicaceae bacterium]|nr:ABC transporter substrate-binding protein [Crocinitomicaceae bacterium]